MEEHTYAFNEAVCDLFEANGYPTIRQDYATTRGYVHRFGPSVHEAPAISLKGLRPDEKFQVGIVFCGEYDSDDPRGGWGVRIEDDYCCNLDGRFERLTNFDHDLVVLLS